MGYIGDKIDDFRIRRNGGIIHRYKENGVIKSNANDINPLYFSSFIISDVNRRIIADYNKKKETIRIFDDSLRKDDSIITVFSRYGDQKTVRVLYGDHILDMTTYEREGKISAFEADVNERGFHNRVSDIEHLTKLCSDLGITKDSYKGFFENYASELFQSIGLDKKDLYEINNVPVYLIAGNERVLME